MPVAEHKGTWVVKIGSSLLANDGLDLDAVRTISMGVARLAEDGIRAVLVSSGAVAAGNAVLQGGGSRATTDIAYMQAAAAVGQASVIRAYEQELAVLGLKTAQVLLTHEDIGDRKRYLNARNTLRFLLQLGVIPVVNENDTVATDEIQFGDNDTLGGMVANLVQAERLVILTDQPGLMSADPRTSKTVELVSHGIAGDSALESIAGEGYGHGRGGMRTKLKAAAIAALSGCDTWIADGRREGILFSILQNEAGVATCLQAAKGGVAARKGWLFGQTRVQGRLQLDRGAVEYIRHRGSSLLAVGVSGVEGNFARGALVSLHAQDGSEVGKGLVNYDSTEVSRIVGLRSEQIEGVLGYVREPELIHRDNLAFPIK